MWYVYILRCSDQSLYTGVCKNLPKRVEEHNHSVLGAKYTQSRRPVHLVRSQEVHNRSQAMQKEYTIKKMTKSKKEQLVANQEILI
ncbi:MAG: GIY-YIG nuclease family protein [bacterium]|nr:GIY-YIG nuclease family protein [bacterium]